MFPTILIALLAVGSASAAPVLEAELPPTTVYGSRRLRRESDRKTELPGESIPAEGAETSVADLLRRSPSVEVRETGGEGSTPVYLLRGLDPIQTRYFLDGVPLTDAAFNYANASLVPIEVVRSADVYAEGVPVALGDDGLGGAIDLRVAGDCAKSRAGTRGGSFGYFRAWGRACAPGRWRLHLDAARSTEDFPFFDDGGAPFNPAVHTITRRAHNGFRRLTAYPDLTLYRDGRRELGLSSLTTYGEKEVPGPVGIPSTAGLASWYSLTTLHYKSEVFDARAFARLDQQRLSGDDSPAAAFLPGRTRDLAVGGRAGFRFSGLGADWEGLAGAGRDAFAVESELGDKASARWEVPVGLSARVPVAGGLSVRPAVLGHAYHYTLEGGASRTEWLASPRVGIVARPAKAWQLRATVGRFYRAPSLVELYGSPSGISASPRLVPESALKADAGVDYDVARPLPGISALRLSYTFAASGARDLIAYVQNSQQTRVAVNVGESRIRSHELAAELIAEHDLSVRGSLAFLATENRSDIVGQTGKELPLRPGSQATVAVAYRRPRWSVSYELAWRGRAWQDLVNEKRLDSVAEHNVRAWWETGALGRIGIELLNLGDTTTVPAQAGGYTTTDYATGYFGYPAPGRRWYLSWQCEL